MLAAQSTSTHAAPPVFTLIPFVALLLAVAVLPIVPRLARWWESNFSKLVVSLACGIAALVMIGGTLGTGPCEAALTNAVADFVPFIILLGALFVISGGILITGDLKGTPAVNTGILTLGAVLANVLGTTGASMLLIRPLLRSNAGRSHRAHSVVFFIFVVSNMGGLLLPIGDPPLFLGYLRGVPFQWTLQLWNVWAVGVFATLVVFFAIDSSLQGRESRELTPVKELSVLHGASLGARSEPPARPAPPARSAPPAPPITDSDSPRLRISGALNVVWLAGVVWAMAALAPGRVLHWTDWTVPYGAREAVTIACALASLLLTPRVVRAENRFAFAPILEVAALFSGLFIALQPALLLLEVHGAHLGVQSPAQFFWCTGALSSFLDNAPTYLVFADIGTSITPADTVGAIPFAAGVIAPNVLAAISCGAVFMGAMTYIGNGPNLMVAAIAREDGVRMPNFFGYMLWSAVVLLPIFAIITLMFFMR